MNNTYTKAIIVTFTSYEDGQKHWGLTHPLYDDFIVTKQSEGIFPLAMIDEYPDTVCIGDCTFKDVFTSAEIRDQWLEVIKAVSEDLGTPFTHEFLDIEPFTYP